MNTASVLMTSIGSFNMGREPVSDFEFFFSAAEEQIDLQLTRWK